MTTLTKVTTLISKREDPRFPGRKPFQSYNIEFFDELESPPIEKIGLGVADLSWDPFTTATEMSFKIGHTLEGSFKVLEDDAGLPLTVDLTSKDTFGFSALAAYAYYIIVLDVAEPNNVRAGHL